MVATTLVQSRHLLELGLDPKTADMCFEIEKGKWHLNIGKKSAQVNRGLAIPAWSLTALLKVMPAMIVYPTLVDKRPTDVWFNLDKDYNRETKKQFYMCYYKSLDTHQLAKNTDPSCSSPIDAAYEMVCWLLEQGLIKKGGQDDNNHQ